LGRNWYLLIRDPYLTVKGIVEKRDKSQILLIGMTAMAPAVLYLIARVITDLIFYRQILWMTGRVFLVAGLIQMTVLVYLGYWTIQVIRKNPPSSA